MGPILVFPRIYFIAVVLWCLIDKLMIALLTAVAICQVDEFMGLSKSGSSLLQGILPYSELD